MLLLLRGRGRFPLSSWGTQHALGCTVSALSVCVEGCGVCFLNAANPQVKGMTVLFVSCANTQHTHLVSFTAKTTCRMQGNKFSEKTEAEFTDSGHLNTHVFVFFLSWGDLANRNRWFAQVLWKRSLDLPQLHIFTQQVQSSQTLGGKQEKKRATLSARKTVQLIQKGPN